MARSVKKRVKNKKKISRNRREFYDKYKSYRSMAYNAYKGVKMLKGLVNVEKKFFDVAQAGLIEDSGTITPLNNMAAGDDFNQRNGNSILAKYITYKATCTINASATSTYVRAIIFMDLSNQGTAPVITDLLQTVTIGNGIVSPRNADNTDRFWTLFDRVVPLSVDGRRTATMKGYIPLDVHLKYNSTSASVDTNAMYLLLLSDQDLSGTSPTVTWHSRLAFYDN